MWCWRAYSIQSNTRRCLGAKTQAHQIGHCVAGGVEHVRTARTASLLEGLLSETQVTQRRSARPNHLRNAVPLDDDNTSTSTLTLDHTHAIRVPARYSLPPLVLLLLLPLGGAGSRAGPHLSSITPDSHSLTLSPTTYLVIGYNDEDVALLLPSSPPPRRLSSS